MERRVRSVTAASRFAARIDSRLFISDFRVARSSGRNREKLLLLHDFQFLLLETPSVDDATGFRKPRVNTTQVQRNSPARPEILSPNGCVGETKTTAAEKRRRPAASETAFLSSTFAGSERSRSFIPRGTTDVYFPARN